MSTQVTSLPLCGVPGCGSAGPFETPDGPRCFVHAEGGTVPSAAESAVSLAASDDEPSFRVDVVAGLAAIVLDHTAICMTGEADATAAASVSLATATGMSLDLAAGLLLATTWLVAAGELTDEQVTTGAETYEAQADGETPPDDTMVYGAVEDVPVCDYCGEAHTVEQHDELYPLNDADEDADADNESEVGE